MKERQTKPLRTFNYYSVALSELSRKQFGRLHDVWAKFLDVLCECTPAVSGNSSTNGGACSTAGRPDLGRQLHALFCTHVFFSDDPSVWVNRDLIGLRIY
jgi:hypothetical protein